jgi:hypothetical protein
MAESPASRWLSESGVMEVGSSRASETVGSVGRGGAGVRLAQARGLGELGSLMVGDTTVMR